MDALNHDHDDSSIAAQIYEIYKICPDARSWNIRIIPADETPNRNKKEKKEEKLNGWPYLELVFQRCYH
jgi:hypothetical protein